MGQKASSTLKIPDTQEAEPIKKKKTVMFTADTVDKNVDADDLFSQANQDRSHFDSRMTYGGTDAMMKERTDTVYKSKELSDEQKRAAIMGPAAKAKKKRDEYMQKKQERDLVKEAEKQE